MVKYFSLNGLTICKLSLASPSACANKPFDKLLDGKTKKEILQLHIDHPLC